MGRFLSMDLGERVSRFVLPGASRRAAARHFRVSESFAIKLMQAQARSGSPAPKRQGRPRGSGRLAPYEGFLIAQVEAKPDITMPELAGGLLERHGVAAAPAVLSRLLCRHGFTYGKKPFWPRNAHALTSPPGVGAGARAASPGCAVSHIAWCSSMIPNPVDQFGTITPPPRYTGQDCAPAPELINRIWYETAVTTKVTRPRGRSRKGRRLKATAPFGRCGTQTFTAALRCDGLTAPWVIDTAINRVAFDTYVETQLAPTLHKGDVVILDNLAVHQSPRAAACLKEKGAWFLFLPPYGPDLNPIEMAFAKLKAHLRKTGARSFDTLQNAIGNICNLFSSTERWNFLKADGYASD